MRAEDVQLGDEVVFQGETWSVWDTAPPRPGCECTGRGVERTCGRGHRSHWYLTNGEQAVNAPVEAFEPVHTQTALLDEAGA